jgi:hypothetical protein
MDDQTFFRALAMQAALAQGVRDDLLFQRATAYAGQIEAFARLRTSPTTARPQLPAPHDEANSNAVQHRR